MEQNQEKDHWVVWYPSYTHKDFELIDRDNDQPIIEDLTDSCFSSTHTYLKIETTPPTIEGKKENIKLSFYEMVRPKNMLYKFSVWLFRKGFLANRPQIKPIPNDRLLRQLTEDKCVATIDLIYKKHSSNGLFLYQCQADEQSKKYLFEGQPLSEDKDQFSTFYCIKQLYHNHLFHKKSKQKKQYKDYYFRAYLTNEINIKAKNNDAIVFYLEKILEYFELQLKHFEEIKTNTNADINAQKRKINEDIKELQERIRDVSDNDPKAIYLKKIWQEEINKRGKSREQLIIVHKEKKDKRGLFLISNDIVGETLFTNVLCCSKYADLDGRNDTVRRLLLNIENVKTGLHYIRDNYRYWYDRQGYKKSYSKTYAGYFAGIVGIVFAFLIFWWSNKSSQKQQEKIERLFQKQDSLIINTINNSVKKDTVYIEVSKPAPNATTQ